MKRLLDLLIRIRWDGLREHLNVDIDARDFGVTGDGITDDTEALQRAIDAAALADSAAIWLAGTIRITTA